MIVLSGDLVFPPTGEGEANPNSPLVGWRNLVTPSNIAATFTDPSTAVADLANPSTYLRWLSNSTALQFLTVAGLSSPDLVDYLAVAGHNFGTAKTPLMVQGHNGVDAFTKLLLHCDGTDASTSFVDSSPSPKTFTANGNAQIDTAQFKFGASGLFDGTGDFVTTPDHAELTLGSGNWTIDTWFNCTAAGGTAKLLAGQCDAGLTAASTSAIVFRASTNVIVGRAAVGGVLFDVNGITQFTNVLNTGWHHLAFVRSGNILRLFIDGVQEGSDVAIAGTVNDSSSVYGVGTCGANGAAPWEGWIDEFRLSVGIARWTANFAPPAAEHPWQALSPETMLGDDAPVLFRFTPTALQAARLQMNSGGLTPPSAAVVYVGKLLALPRRLYVGHAPLPFNRRANIVTGRSESGNFLGRIVLNEVTETRVDLPHILPAFYRSDIEPWLKKALIDPFFFAWRPGGYPLEVGYCWLGGDARMSNQLANGMVQVSLDLQGIVK